MKKRTLKFVSIIISVIVVILCLPINVGSYDQYTYSSYSNLNNLRMIQNESQVFLIGTNDNIVQIDAVYPQEYNVSLTLENAAYSYNLCDDTFIAVCPQKELSQTQIVLYNIYDDILSTFNISSAEYFESSQIAYSNGYVYLANNRGVVKCFSKQGKHIKTYNLYDSACYVSCNYNGDVYALTDDGIYLLQNDSADLLCDTFVDAPITFIDYDKFVDDTGNVRCIKNNTVNTLCNIKSSVYYPSGGIYSGQTFISNFDNIFAVDISSNNIKKCIELTQEIEGICVIGSTIIALTHQSSSPIISIIPYSSFLDYSATNVDSNVTTDDFSIISSDLYNVDNVNLKITDVNAETTVAQFKSNMNYEGYNITFERYDGKVYTSGKVGTASVVTFYNNELSIEYELAVLGDLTGEGSVNSRDKKMMFGYILDTISFTGVYLDAADLDNSSSVDLADLVYLVRLVKRINE